MIDVLHIDFESQGTAELRGPKSVGLWNYIRHKETRPLILGWGLNNDNVSAWELHKGAMPKDLRDSLEDPSVLINAFNSAFERYMLNFKLGFDLPASRFIDPQASARYLSLPGDLDEVSTILGLPQDLAKDRRGKQLIDLFSKPHKKKKKRDEAIEWIFYNWESHPKEWEEFVEYCFEPHHRLLGENLIWKEADKFKEGDVILGFDEHGPSRKFRKATIEKISFANQETFDVELESGKHFFVTADHKWLVSHRHNIGGRSQCLKWVETRRLVSKSERKDFSCSRIPKIMPVWDQINSYDIGWLGGIFDGEGSLQFCSFPDGHKTFTNVSVVQNSGLVLDQIKKFLKARNFDFKEYDHKKCQRLVITGGRAESVRLLGVVRANRLIKKINFNEFGRLECRFGTETIKSIKSRGIQKIIQIRTSTGTLVVDGYPMHNCKQDVVAEREVLRREALLGVYPLPPLERQIWLFDQKVNDRGIPVDRHFVTNALSLASREKQEKIEENNKLTGLENSNSNSQMTAWLLTQGYAGKDPEILEGNPEYPKYSLEKDIVKAELKNNKDLTSLARQVLEIRKSASSTSYKKMAAILRQLGDDDRLRGQFIYMGSSRCGRWSGNAVQLHNMARPNEIFENVENVDKARSLICSMDYDEIKKQFGSVLLTVKYNIRTAFVAKPGQRFNVSDLNAIETRVGAWMAGCEPLLQGFRTIKDFDPYMDFATKMTQIPYDVLMADKKSKDPVRKAAAKKYRQIAKPGVLGCVYRMSAKTLMDYAEKMGVVMTMAQAEEVVKVFRTAYREIAEFWNTIENTVMEVMRAEGKITRSIGPNGCIKISKFIFNCGGVSRNILRIQLPSGRYLHYMDARIERTLMPWKDREGQDVYRDALWYATQDQETKQWSETTTHGGKLFENIDQGISRDVLATKLLMLEDYGLLIVSHVHDEGLSETEDTPFDPGIREMTEIMDAPIDWAPGLPLGSAGFEGFYYRKD